MHQGLNISRAWPALILAFFCLPLFIGLGNQDLQGDEAGHSFSVDRILETGDWLIPKSSPYPDLPFLEKPPLKFWIVAAGIKAGLPLTEFGLRFWDPVFGGLAFLYLYGIGRRIGGPLCGAVAVMILFVHGPLVTFHGLRSNDMEAPLFLGYCGGMFHYLAWAEADDNRRHRWLHALAVAVYFSLGFMVKFVAAAFLPVVLALVSLLAGSYRRRVLRDWRIWLGASVLAIALIAPWFVYGTLLYPTFWSVIFGSHVYTRLTSYLDPAHVNPWNFYFLQLYDHLRYSDSLWLVLIGSPLLIADAIRRRRPEGLLIILWYAVPLAIISVGTSKLYHYSYPFLPPVAIAGGYVASFLWNIVRPRVELAMRAVGRIGDLGSSRFLSGLRNPVLRGVFLTAAGISIVVMTWTLVSGPVILRYHDSTVFKNGGLLRPALIAAVMTVLGGWPEGIGRFGIPVLILAIVPTNAYRATLKGFAVGSPTMRLTRDCILQVGRQPALMAGGPRGMYIDGDGGDNNYETPFRHEYAYYFRMVRPWMRPRHAPPPVLYRYLFDPAQERPLLIAESRYHAFLNHLPVVPGVAPRTPPPLVTFQNGEVILVLPGPYGVCGPQSTGVGIVR